MPAEVFRDLEAGWWNVVLHGCARTQTATGVGCAGGCPLGGGRAGVPLDFLTWATVDGCGNGTVGRQIYGPRHG